MSQAGLHRPSGALAAGKDWTNGEDAQGVFGRVTIAVVRVALKFKPDVNAVD